MKKLKIISVLIALFILLSIAVMFASCAKDDEKTAGDDESGTTANVLENEETGNTDKKDEGKILPKLGEADFGGYEFTVLTRGTGGGLDWDDWASRDVEYKEELSGDTINDAVFKRNTYIEDKYNFTIVQIGGNPLDMLKKAVQVNDDLYDVAYPSLRDGPTLAQEGFLMDLYKVPNLDLTQPWWDQNANKALSFGGKLFFMSGDINIVSMDSCPSILFNKKLWEEYQLESLSAGS